MVNNFPASFQQLPCIQQCDIADVVIPLQPLAAHSQVHSFTNSPIHWFTASAQYNPN
jgi:hypothetical protein